MDDVLKRRLIGALVLLLAALLLAFLLPRPGPAPVQEGLRRVTLDLRAAEPAPVPPSSEVLPPVLAGVEPAPQAPAPGPDALPPATRSASDPALAAKPARHTEAAASSSNATVQSRSAQALVAQKTASPEAGIPEARKNDEQSGEPPPVQLKPTDRLSQVPRAVEPTRAGEGAKAPEAVASAHPVGASTKPGSAPAPVPESAPAASAADGQTQRQRWSVQIGSFAEVANAQQVEARLKAAGLPSVIMPIETSKGVLHRVRVAPLAGEAEARAAKLRVQELGFTTATIRTD